MRVSWTARSPLNCKEINQSILKDINPEYSWEGLMLKLKLQYFGHLMLRPDFRKESFSLMLGKIEGNRRSEWQRMRCFNSITDSMDINLSKLWEMVKDREAWQTAAAAMGSSRVGNK